jgi:hypothetical protein
VRGLHGHGGTPLCPRARHWGLLLATGCIALLAYRWHQHRIAAAEKHTRCPVTHVQGVSAKGDDFLLGYRAESDVNVVLWTKKSLIMLVMTLMRLIRGTSIIATVGSATSHVTIGL